MQRRSGHSVRPAAHEPLHYIGSPNRNVDRDQNRWEDRSRHKRIIAALRSHAVASGLAPATAFDAERLAGHPARDGSSWTPPIYRRYLHRHLSGLGSARWAGSPAKAALMTSRDGYIWFAVALAVAIVMLACIAIWT